MHFGEKKNHFATKLATALHAGARKHGGMCTRYSMYVNMQHFPSAFPTIWCINMHLEYDEIINYGIKYKVVVALMQELSTPFQVTYNLISHSFSGLQGGGGGGGGGGAVPPEYLAV